MKTELSRRDYFAAMAMQGLLAWDGDMDQEHIPPLSVKYADALIAELERTASTVKESFTVQKPDPADFNTGDRSGYLPDPGNDGWIPHNPGDPMPCEPDLKVFMRFEDGTETNVPTIAATWRWKNTGSPPWKITAWKPA
jgi:hypothetical protein